MNSTVLPPRVSAVVVAFHPDPDDLIHLVSMIGPQVASIALICNSLIDTSLLKPCPDCLLRVLQNRENVGLAAAQNQGIALCVEDSAEFLLFLDQDSRPPEKLVSRLLAADAMLTSAGEPVGGVGPLLVESLTGDTWPFMRSGWWRTVETTAPEIAGTCRADFLYSSGSLIRIDHFRRMGDMLEHLFIDHVDLEWCYRAGSKGLKFFGVPSILMEHRVGDGRVKLLGRLHPMHSASRNYYAFRNSVILMGQRHVPLSWKLNEALRLLPRALFYGLLSKQLLHHSGACLRGIIDGITYLKLKDT
jgi:rhamnosyltransferase